MNEDEPDFEALYEPGLADGASMTPRMAYWLWRAAVYLADTWRESRDDPELPAEILPPIARPIAHGEWLNRFVDGFDRLAARIAAGEGEQDRLATYTGEELALHLIVDLAEAYLADGIIGTESGVRRAFGSRR